MTVFDSIAKVFNSPKKATLPTLERAEADAMAALQAARGRVSELEAGRTEAVLAGDAARADHRTALQAARDDVEDAEAALAAIRARLSQDRAAAAEITRLAAYDAARAKRDAAAEAIRVRYPAAAAELLALIALAAEADAAVEAVNADLPAGATPLDDAEGLVRDVPGLPRQVIDERRVSLWCVAGTTRPADKQSGIVDRGGDRGARVVPAGSGRGTSEVPFERRDFIARTIREGRNAEFGPRLRGLDLPSLVAGEPDLWATASWADPVLVLRKLAEGEDLRRAFQPEPAEPKTITIYELASPAVAAE